MRLLHSYIPLFKGDFFIFGCILCCIFSKTLFVLSRGNTPKVRGILMKHTGTWEQSLPFNASATLKLSKSNSVYDIIIHRNMFCLVYQRKNNDIVCCGSDIQCRYFYGMMNMNLSKDDGKVPTG